MKTLKIMNFTPSLTRTAWYQMTHGPVPVWSPLLLHFFPLASVLCAPFGTADAIWTLFCLQPY